MSEKSTVSDGQRAASDPLAGQAADARYKSFNETADPWKVIGTLAYGEDRTMVSTVFHAELLLQRRFELARRALRLWQEGRGVWARTANRSVY